jgi:hypothetical protein
LDGDPIDVEEGYHIVVYVESSVSSAYGSGILANYYVSELFDGIFDADELRVQRANDGSSTNAVRGLDGNAWVGGINPANGRQRTIDIPVVIRADGLTGSIGISHILWQALPAPRLGWSDGNKPEITNAQRGMTREELGALGWKSEQMNWVTGLGAHYSGTIRCDVEGENDIWVVIYMGDGRVFGEPMRVYTHLPNSTTPIGQTRFDNTAPAILTAVPVRQTFGFSDIATFNVTVDDRVGPNIAPTIPVNRTSGLSEIMAAPANLVTAAQSQQDPWQFLINEWGVYDGIGDGIVVRVPVGRDDTEATIVIPMFEEIFGDWSIVAVDNADNISPVRNVHVPRLSTLQILNPSLKSDGADVSLSTNRFNNPLRVGSDQTINLDALIRRSGNAHGFTDLIDISASLVLERMTNNAILLENATWAPARLSDDLVPPFRFTHGAAVQIGGANGRIERTASLNFKFDDLRQPFDRFANPHITNPTKYDKELLESGLYRLTVTPTDAINTSTASNVVQEREVVVFFRYDNTALAVRGVTFVHEPTQTKLDPEDLISDTNTALASFSLDQDIVAPVRIGDKIIVEVELTTLPRPSLEFGDRAQYEILVGGQIVLLENVTAQVTSTLHDGVPGTTTPSAPPTPPSSTLPTPGFTVFRTFTAPDSRTVPTSDTDPTPVPANPPNIIVLGSSGGRPHVLLRGEMIIGNNIKSVTANSAPTSAWTTAVTDGTRNFGSWEEGQWEDGSATMRLNYYDAETFHAPAIALEGHDYIMFELVMESMSGQQVTHKGTTGYSISATVPAMIGAVRPNIFGAQAAVNYWLRSAEMPNLVRNYAMFTKAFLADIEGNSEGALLEFIFETNTPITPVYWGLDPMDWWNLTEGDEKFYNFYDGFAIESQFEFTFEVKETKTRYINRIDLEDLVPDGNDNEFMFDEGAAKLYTISLEAPFTNKLVIPADMFLDNFFRQGTSEPFDFLDAEEYLDIDLHLRLVSLSGVPQATPVTVLRRMLRFEHEEAKVLISNALGAEIRFGLEWVNPKTRLLPPASLRHRERGLRPDMPALSLHGANRETIINIAQVVSERRPEDMETIVFPEVVFRVVRGVATAPVAGGNIATVRATALTAAFNDTPVPQTGFGSWTVLEQNNTVFKSQIVFINGTNLNCDFRNPAAPTAINLQERIEGSNVVVDVAGVAIRVTSWTGDVETYYFEFEHSDITIDLKEVANHKPGGTANNGIHVTDGGFATVIRLGADAKLSDLVIRRTEFGATSNEYSHWTRPDEGEFKVNDLNEILESLLQPKTAANGEEYAAHITRNRMNLHDERAIAELIGGKELVIGVNTAANHPTNLNDRNAAQRSNQLFRTIHLGSNGAIGYVQLVHKEAGNPELILTIFAEGIYHVTVTNDKGMTDELVALVRIPVRR